ncbi:MAG: plasmid mobilization relaxosome protein MobC [Puia sp.]
MKEKINRSFDLHVRLNPKERERINEKFSHSTDRKMSDYIRKVLLNKTITVKQRNQSFDDFMTEMISLRKELNAIGINYNQVVKRLHTLDDIPQIKTWLLLHASSGQILLNKITEIKSKISQLDSQWLR